MIKANELRVGSWINQLVRTDCGIHSAPFCCSEDFLEVLFASRDYENYDPIPLTPEILEKYKIKGKHFCDEFFLETNLSGVLIGRRPHGVKYLRNIKYLHQLQNLYYDLTGEELPININAFSTIT